MPRRQADSRASRLLPAQRNVCRSGYLPHPYSIPCDIHPHMQSRCVWPLLTDKAVFRVIKQTATGRSWLEFEWSHLLRDD